MKKLILSSAFILGLVTFSFGQDISKNALGLRLGDNDGFGAEVSYQRGLSTNNRLELDLGLRSNDAYSSFKLAGLYQWVWNIDGGFNWYAGAGGGVASYSGKDVVIYGTRYNGGSNTAAFVAGDIGIEYLFDFPLQLSLDFRPELYFSDGINDDFGTDIALGIRYRF